MLCVAALIAPTAAFAHLERPSYWPDPRPDTAVTPAAGGKTPTARSLASAVTGAGPGRVRVVCQRNSLQLAKRAIRAARTRGFRLRPSQPITRYSARKTTQMIALNEKLRRQCAFTTIQPAIDASRNNDRVVIMPGVYTEPASRARPVNDPKCNPTLLQKDASGDQTPSFEYQVTCPHDQNLVYVAGRATKGKPLATPRDNRQGIPDEELGACVRCNFQIEGSGPKPEDVILDAGSDYKSNAADARPGKPGKHVVMRVDRADGFVGRNMLFRGALEYGFYVEETDGVLLDKTKFFWNLDYGHLSFTTDHNVIQNCDGLGAGDAVVYPGAAAETGAQADKSFYPDAPRKSTVIRNCDLRNSQQGYSGSMGNAVRITNNHIYGNTTGIASDSLYSAGHPGFPADSSEIDHNFIYSNNSNSYAPDSKVRPLVGVPVGTGIIYAGMNSARVHHNWFFDNWRYGAMLIAVPDALTTNGRAEGNVNPGVACPGAPENKLSTSCGNSYFRNRLGQVPAGFRFPKTLDAFGVPHGTRGATTLPNGTDFWWDEFAGNTGNCWYKNAGPNGKESSVTGPGGAGRLPATPPNRLPNCAGGSDPASSVGGGDAAKQQYLIDCANGPDKDTSLLACDWWVAPAKPRSRRAARALSARAAAAGDYNASAKGRAMLTRMRRYTAGG